MSSNSSNTNIGDDDSAAVAASAATAATAVEAAYKHNKKTRTAMQAQVAIACRQCNTFVKGDAIKRCSACKEACYCSRECQLAHWKTHKPECLIKQETVKLSALADQKRQYRLFNEWTDRAFEGNVALEIIKYFGVAQIKQVQREQKAIVFKLEFDYNLRTFFPVNPPVLLTPPELHSTIPSSPSHPQDAASVTIKYYEDFNQKCDKTLVDKALAFVVVYRYKTCTSVSIRAVQDVPTQKKIASISWKKMQQDAFQHPSLVLNSSLFDVGWQTLQQENVMKQLGLVRQSPHYQNFLVNALHIHTRQPRYATHVIMVQMKMGLGLGQIDSLESFSILTLAKAKEQFKKLLSPAMLPQYEHYTNESGSTVNNNSNSNNNSKWVVLHVFYWGNPNFYIVPTQLEILDGQHHHQQQMIAPTKSDKKAQQAFQQLLKIALPQVESPELH